MTAGLQLSDSFSGTNRQPIALNRSRIADAPQRGRSMFAKSWLKLFMIAVLLLGIVFRCVNLDRKVFWVDEVATAIRTAGYTRSEVTQSLVDRGIVHAADLQQYQRLSPDRGIDATLKALVKSPEHAPLYFLLARVWQQQFGSSVAVLRSLSVVFSILALPCVYWLCLEVFRYCAATLAGSPLVGGIAVTLLAISPFYVAYAQEARPYSLWTLCILLSNITLLRAIRLKRSVNWCLYGISLVLSFYTSLLSILVAIGHSLYVIGIENRWTKVLKAQVITLAASLLVFTPWLLVVVLNWQHLEDNTTWMRVPMALPYMAAVWSYSLVVLFADFPVYAPFDRVIISCILADFALLGLVGFSCYFLYKKTPRQIWLFVLTLILVTPSVLIFIDLVRSGQSSATPRYLIPCHLGVLLSIAYLLSSKMYSAKHPQIWRILTVFLVSLGIASCAVDLNRSPMYQKTRSLHNAAIAAIVNQVKLPVLLADPKETIDLLSLSYNLDPKVEIQLLPKANLPQFLQQCKDVFLFNPSEGLLSQMQENRSIEIAQIYKPKLLIVDEISLSLWSIKNAQSRCLMEG